MISRVCLLMLGFCFVTGACFAQKPPRELGVTVGPTYTKMRAEDFLPGYDARIGFSAGVYLRLPIDERWSLVLNPAFERKGSKADVTRADQSGSRLTKTTTYLNFDYIVLPLAARYDFAPLYATGGVYAGLLQRQFFDLGYDTSDQPIITDYTEQFDKPDFGLLFGLGFRKDLNPSIATFAEIRHTHGFSNVVQEHEEINYELRNRSTLLVLGITRKF